MGGEGDGGFRRCDRLCGCDRDVDINKNEKATLLKEVSEISDMDSVQEVSEISVRTHCNNVALLCCIRWSISDHEDIAEERRIAGGEWWAVKV